MNKICFVTAARSEYGILKWLMKEVNSTDKLKLQLVVTGGHLLQEQGHTIDHIIQDGFDVDIVFDSHLDNKSTANIAASMGRIAEGMASVFEKLQPDYLVVLGDRYELLPVCSTAFVMNIPIIHLSGGDTTEGAIDDGIRNAVTMLATYHFPGTEESADNIRRMRATNENIWVVGELGLDAFNRETLMDRETLAIALELDIHKRWILMTFHSETKDTLENSLDTVRNCCEVLRKLKDTQIVMTYANADFGGKHINEYIEKVAESDRYRFKCIPSLGSLRYLSMMKQVSLIVGNSSSGIIEAPSCRVPVINIGDRQKGRHLCSNIIQCGKSCEEISTAIEKGLNWKVDNSDVDYWGDGHTSERIMNVLVNKIIS